jgi:hypothetical protein
VGTRMPNESAQVKSKGTSEVSADPTEMYQKKLQRILKNSAMDNQHLSGGVAPFELRRISEQAKEAMLSPRLVNPASVQEEEPLFQCTECDMIVKGSDPYCPFCGAIFADGPLAEQQRGEEDEEKPFAERPMIDKPIRREPMVRPEMFDIFSMLKTGSRSRDLMYQEALRGFSGSARLLEEIEHLISDISSLGTDTSKARRLISSAWEACRDGDWNLVTTIARQAEQMIEPSIPNLVRSEIARAREYLATAKVAGVDISGYVVKIKSAMAALHGGDPDEALRLTKELMDSLREDSISWK